MKMLIYDPEQRITASEALRHEYFRDLKEIDSLKQFQKTLYLSTQPHDLPSAFKNIGGKGSKPQQEEKPEPPTSIPIKIMGGGQSKHKAKEFYTNK